LVIGTKYPRIDNSSVVWQLQALLLGYPPKRAYPHVADIISHVRWLLTQLPRFQHKVSWVKAHQGDKTSFHLLDLPAQLNIRADAMATEYSTDASPPRNVPTSQPAGFPSAKVCLLIKSHRITAQYSASIWFHIMAQNIAPTYSKLDLHGNLTGFGTALTCKVLV
jgi:hypothetical protein